MMNKYNWHNKLTKGEEREPNCLISPEGGWYSVPRTDHEDFAEAYLRECKPAIKVESENNSSRKYSDALKKLGWIVVYSDPFTGTIVTGEMNEEQYTVLYEVFGDNPLFRGWTIKSLWKRKWE